MMDMGGVPQASVDTHINVGKNNKVRAVVLDFHLITRSIEERRRQADAEKENASGGGAGNRSQKSTSAAPAAAAAPVEPDTSLVEKMANLLNVTLGSSNANKKKSTPKVVSSPHMDIRSKYAAKLRKTIDGGVAGLELAKSEKEDPLKRGDASFHMAARDLLSSGGMLDESNTSSTRWLATTGVGKLLSFVSGRSMQIALLPLPSTTTRPQTGEDVQKTSEEMESLTRQLPYIKFNLLVPDGRSEKSNDNAAEDVLKNVLSKMDIPPVKFVVVSDRDDYLKAARDNGMFTCRIQPKNKRRGDITTNYTVEDVGSVQDVINEINGISFNYAFKG
eukprot:CAMPEP_0201920086 /NCGR_PEP_ID=MMETSP0903-20130614/8790_1 /ASSEMBLY_ACC=CAM_ASM_000552 /TAXON_ID=420261 /ORGANISM="Thalassiosira antarctica, Strain CCMP982" /LENGTH=332 /DNA_ID=CAMNT_0048456747 /DNA_START=215 /DNA_END=1213 /DNA_ORIENTATION=-